MPQSPISLPTGESVAAPVSMAEAEPVSPGNGHAAGVPHSARKALLLQFVKFCVVGFSSLTISLGVFYGLILGLHLPDWMHNALAGSPALQRAVDEYHLYVQVAAFAGFIFGVTNGFIWNSRWTFPNADPARRHIQAVRFLAVNVLGQMFNQCILFMMMQLLAGGRTREELTWEMHAAVGTATVLVAFWNFGANRLWAFKN